jgi:hypothetical protein
VTGVVMKKRIEEKNSGEFLLKDGVSARKVSRNDDGTIISFELSHGSTWVPVRYREGLRLYTVEGDDFTQEERIMISESVRAFARKEKAKVSVNEFFVPFVRLGHYDYDSLLSGYEGRIARYFYLRRKERDAKPTVLEGELRTRLSRQEADGKDCADLIGPTRSYRICDGHGAVAIFTPGSYGIIELDGIFYDISRLLRRDVSA